MLLTLKGLDIANFLTDEELEQMIEASERHTYDAGSVLVAEGEVSQSLDIIVHGIVETSIMAGKKSSKIIDEMKPGQYYGLYSMIVDGTSFQQFTAATDVTVIRVHMEFIRELLKKRPDLQEEFAKVVKQRMDAAQEVRLRCNKAPVRHSFQDILRKIEALVH